MRHGMNMTTNTRTRRSRRRIAATSSTIGMLSFSISSSSSSSSSSLWNLIHLVAAVLFCLLGHWTVVHAVQFPNERELEQRILDGDHTDTLSFTLLAYQTDEERAQVIDQIAKETEQWCSKPSRVIRSVLEQYYSEQEEKRNAEQSAQQTTAEGGGGGTTNIPPPSVPAAILELEQKHRDHGLHLLMEMWCPTTMDDNGDDSNIDNTQLLPGRGPQKVIAILKQHMLDNDWNNTNVDNQTAAAAGHSLELVEVDYRIIDAATHSSSSSWYDTTNAQEEEEEPEYEEEEELTQRILNGADPLQASQPVDPPVKTNDPRFEGQINLRTIHVPEAWHFLKRRNVWSEASNVVVQVIDSGWNPRHPDAGSTLRNSSRLCCCCCRLINPDFFAFLPLSFLYIFYKYICSQSMDQCRRNELL